MKLRWGLSALLFLFPALNVRAQFAYVENSDTQFNAGAYNSTYVSVTGSTATLGLDYYGRASGVYAPGPAAWFNGSWKYRQPVLVTSSNTATLSDYAVPVTVNTAALISAGRMNTDGSDIRFTAASGLAPSLGYYIESGLNTSATKIWVKTTAVNNGPNTLYMYYGYPPASPASGMASAFVMGSDFNAADGSVPSSATWVNIESAPPLASSARDIQSNRLRMLFGSPLGLRHYGLRSASQYSFASPRRYHADVNARNTGSDSWSGITLCPSIYTYSYDQDDWLRFSVKHSAAGPVYTVERSEYGIKTTLVPAAALGAGFHGVDFLISSSTFRIMLDGAQVYSAANDLNFNSPYLYLEASSSYAAYDDFRFDNVFVTPYAAPEPAFDSVGSEQGSRYPSGTFVSQAKDTGAPGTRAQNVDWVSVIPASSTIGVEIRAHDSDIALAAFTPAAKGGDPAVSGRYLQYRLALDTTDPRYSATLSSITLTYVSPPSTPTSAGAQALDSWSMKWYWTDASSGQYQEEGFRLSDSSGAIKGSVSAGTTWWIEAGLNPNTPYTRAIAGYNAAGNGNPAVVVKYTLPAPPSVACDKSTGTWLSGTLTCSNLAGFGANGVTYYRYIWDSSASSRTWSGSETQWLSGTLPFLPGLSGEYYLHVKSYNADGATLAGDQTYGPYWYDKLAPQMTGFSPSSSPWTNSGFPVRVSVADTGGSTLNSVRYKWTTTNDRPYSGWQAWDNSIINTSSSSVNITIGTAGQWYLHVETSDLAGNVGYAYAGTYNIDTTPPGGSIVINGGAAATPRKEVTLSLTYADSESGVKEIAYRNVPGSFFTELPQPTSAWVLIPGDGSKQVYLSVRDNAGNEFFAADTITLDSRTTLTGRSLSVRASGVMGEPPETFNATADLSWTPSGAPLAGKTITFIFLGSTQTALTDSFGTASSSFNVPAASGTFVYSISFSTDGIYSASGSTGIVTAAQRPVSVITEDVNGTSNTPFIAKAILKDFYEEVLITGATVTFIFEGSTLTAVTNGIGVATVTFTAPIPVGFYDYTASYDGGSVYAARTATGRVGVGLKVTSLVVQGVAALVASTFTAQATLLDGVTPVAGGSITFVFLGSTITAPTNGVGVATAAFAAPLSSGSYQYTAAFAGDATYAPSAGAAAVLVSVRPLALAPDTALGYVNASFTVRAVLSDGVSGAKVAGKTIVFVFEGSTRAAATDAAGVSTASFSSGAEAREAECYYYFAGDSGYAFVGSSGAVSIARRPVSLAASDVVTIINSTFTAVAELLDTAFAPAPVAGRTIEFNFGGSVKTAVSDAFGIASVAYPAGVSAGSYQFSATVQQDSVYLAASDTAAVTVSLRPTVLTAYPRFVFALDSIQVVADLKDGVTGGLIGGQPVTFQYNGAPQSTTTASAGTIGRAYGVYAGTGTFGAYTYSATFPGNSVYSANSSTAAITVTQRSVNLSAFPLTAVWSTTFSATAEMRDGATSALLPGKTVRLSFLSSSGYFATSGSGLVSSTFTAPSSTGAFNWVADFAGDPAYGAASSTGTVTVIMRSPSFNALLASKYVLDSVFLSATFFDEGTPVPSKNVSFYFMGSTLTAATNGSGMATAGPFTAVSTPGVYGYSAFFAGDSSYSSQSSSSTLTASARVSRISVSGVSAIANSTFTLSATLLDDIWLTPITGKTVSFNFQSVSSAAVTDSNGIARVSYTAPSVPAAYSYSASFGGSTQYAFTSSTQNVTVNLRPTVLEMADYYPPAASTFTVSAVLKDYTTGVTISTKTVSFLFLGSTKTAVTNALGLASTTYVTLSSTISYPITASFAGDTLYGAAAINKVVYPGRRDTILQTADVSAMAKDSFTVTARLRDYYTVYYIAGATITFSFSGSTFTLTAVTNSTGTATTSGFTAPTSTGAYTYSATFSGNALYNNAVNTSVVTVNRRTLTLTPGDVTSVPANSTFTVTALLRDGAITVSTKTLTFVFYSTKTAVTNGIGVASTTFLAPLSTGTFSYKVTYTGDALYNPATSYANVGVVLKPTVLEVFDVPDAVVGLKFTGTAKLRDIELGNALVLSTKTINIVFGTNTVNAVTSVGVATAAFTAPTTTGTYVYTATFAGDTVYGYSQSTGTVMVGRRPVLFGLTTDPNQPYTYRANAVQSSFTVTATLQDGQVAGLFLENQTVRFVFQGSSQTAVTNALGIASVTYASQPSSGTYACYGYFDGDVGYNPNDPEYSMKGVTFIPRPTYINPSGGNGDLLDDSWIATFHTYSPRGYINDGLSFVGIQGLTASFAVQGATITGVSNAVGLVVSSAPFPWIQYAGVYPATVTFSGNATYAPSVLRGGPDLGQPSQGKVVIDLTPARVALTDIQEVYPDQDVVVSGTAYDYWGRAWARERLIGKQVWYKLSSTPCFMDACAETRTWGAPIYANINATYAATATVHTPLTAGDYPIDVWFNTDASFYQYRVTENQRILRVGRRLTYIVPDSQPFTVGAMMPIELTVKLADASQSFAGINGKNLDVVLITTQTLMTASIPEAGKVKATFPGMAVGTYTYIARFNDGDGTYMPYTSSGTVVVEKNTTVLTALDVSSVPAGNSFIANATLNVIVGTALQPVAGKTINFVFTSTGDPINLSAVTNGVGVATVTYWSPYVPAGYNYTAELPEDAEFKPSSDLTNAVQVVKRKTLVTAEPAFVYILENFISTATLTDTDLGGATVPAKTISFILHKSPDAGGSALTNDIGVATAAFASPASSGTYQYSSTFPGDALYAVSSDTRTLTVSRRVTALDAVDISTPTNSAFTLSVTLKDVTFDLGVSTPISGAQVKFVFDGVTHYETTGADGKASSSFTAPAVSAVYPYSAAFEGNQTFSVIATSGRTVDVRKTNTIVSGTDLLAPAGSPFTSEAQLIDEFGQKLQGYTINFVFTGTTAYNGSGLTDALGVATAAFVSPLSTGTYYYTSSFAGNATYAASNVATSTVAVNVASTTLATPDGTVTVNDVFFATATLKGKTSGVGVANKPIGFTYNGVYLGERFTGLQGLAVNSFTPTSTGTYRLDAVFDGDTAFLASAGSATITVDRRNSGITAPDVITKVGALFIATATLRDLSVVPSTWIAGRTVDFMFEGVPKSAVTNSVGVATVSYTAPSPGGVSYPVTATFDGDAIYGSTATPAMVNVSKLETQLTVASGTVTALELFNATATLKAGGIPVPGKIIQFTYKGSNLSGPATDAEGRSFIQYNAGASSGPWRVDAAFTDAGDPDYNISSGTNTITVLRRTCVVIPDNISMSVFDVFTATATFLDVANSSTPAGKITKMGFSWIGSTFTAAATDGAGKVHLSTTAPVSSGTYRVEAFFTGDATYAPSIASTATVTVDRRPTQLSLADVNTMIGRVFTATATLKNDTALIGNKYVLFTFEGRTFNAKTGTGGSLGIAVATFTVTIATGPTQIDAVFNGDSAYFNSNTATATVTAVMRPTALTPAAASVISGKVFTASATLKDLDLLTVPAKPVDFVFQGATYTAVTNGVGVATVTITAGVSTGTYGIGVYFGGDFKYIASSTTLSLTVLRRPTSIVPLSSVTVRALDVFSATATLKDLDLITLSAKPVYFVFSGSTFTLTTDGSGVAVSTWSAPASSGTYYVGAYFDGDAMYAPSTAAILVGNLQRPTGIALNAVSALALDLFKTTAAVSDLNNGLLKVSTRPVTFSFSWGGSTGALTDAVGVATASYNATATAGSYQLTGAFAGDATYASTTTVVPFPVSKRPDFVTGNYVSARVMDVFIATGTFYDGISSAAVSGRTMKFILQNGSTLTAVTNGVGVATVAFTANAASGTYTLSTFFEGDATYNASSVYVSSVTLLRRDSLISLSAPASAIIGSSVPVTAVLRDSVSLGLVQGRTVSLLFQGSTVPVVTSSFGVAASTYTASLSSGAYEIQASFAGDVSYNVTAATRAITMLRYPAFISASSITVTMNEVLTATATLTDYHASTVPAKALVFYFNSSSFTAVTNGLGVAYSTYAASVSSGVYQLPVSFAGDALYASTGVFIPVSVNRRPSAIGPAPAAVKALNVFTATATLTDGLNTSLKLTGESVKFEFFVGGSTFTNNGTADAAGVAVATFTAPAGSGAYQYKASFAGSAVNYSSAAFGAVAVVVRPSKLVLDAAASPIDEVFRATATLTDLETLAPVSTKTVTFTFGSSSAAATDLSGRAWAAFTAPASSGTFQLNSAFAGDATYGASSSTSALTVTRRPAGLAAPDVAGIIDEIFTSTATLTDALSSAKISTREVSFALSGSTLNAVTGADGVAVSTFAAPSSSGAYTLSLSFAGDARFLPDNTTAQLTVELRPSAIVPDPITVRAAEVFTATAALVDVLKLSDKPAGRAVSFYFSGSTFAAVTGADGVAVSTFTAPVSSGTFALDISFAGDARYLASSSAAAVTVLRRLSGIALDGPTIMAMSTLTVSGTLFDKLNPAVFVPGRSLAFFFSGSTFAAVTDGAGVAVSTFAGPVSSGTYALAASFAGDSVFEESSATSTVTVLQRPVRLLIEPSSAYPYEQFTASAALTDDVSSAAVSGRQLVFELDALEKGALTGGDGVAAVDYTPPGAFGVYELKASFAGDGTYAVQTATGPVSVMQRPTAITAHDAGAPAMDVFVASAALSDVRFASPVAGREVTFTFAGQSSTVTTGADGYAYAAFTAPVSSGVYSYEALFSGTSVYALASSTGAVTVVTRTTRVIARDTNANVGEPFTLSAQLVDPAREDLPGYYVSSGTVEFKFKDRDDLVIDTAFGTTNDLGIATVTFSGPGAPDVYYYTAKFLGNYTYSSSSATAMVKVGLLTSLVAFNVETYALKNFTVNAKLIDYLSTTLDDKLIRFRFLGVDNTGLTYAGGVSGVASSTFTAPASSGTYLYTADFDGDLIYSASNATATVTVLRRPSSILAYAADTTAYSTFTITTVLKDVLNPEMNIGGRDVYLAFNGSTVAVNTAAGTGEAYAQFFAALSSGTYPYYAWFDGDDTFSGTLSTGVVNVALEPTNMLSYNVTDIMVTSTFSAKVQIKDNANEPVKDLSVDFSFEGGFGMGITDAQGIAATVFTAPASSGAYSYGATFYGDVRYAGSTASGDVTVGPRPTMLLTSAVSSKLGTPLELSAKLIDVVRQTGIEGKTVSFLFDGTTITAVTGSLGISTVSFGTPVSTGSYAYETSFIGDGVTFTGSYSSAPVTIALNLTTIEARTGLSIKIYEPLDVEATLKDSIGLNLTGMSVVFTLQGTDLGAVTDEVGRATAAFPTLGFVSTGTYNYTAQYPGDSLYVASSDTSNVVNVLRRDTLLDARDKQSTPSKEFTAEARLFDNVNGSALLGAALAGKTIVMEFFDGISTFTANAVTSGAGVSTAAFMAPVAIGTYPITARFADNDPVYKGFVSSAVLTVLMDDGAGLIKTAVRAEHVDTYITHVFTATAALTASELPVPGKTLLFSFFNGVSTFTAAAATDDLGVATAAFTAPGSSGTFTYTAAFAGDLTYSAAVGTATVDVALFPDSLTARDVAAYIGENFTAEAVLRDELTMEYVAGKTIIFEFFNGVELSVKSAVTSSTGSAEAVFATPAVPGNYTYLARFAGDALYSEALDTASVLIASRGSSTFLVGYDVFIGTGEVFAASATLTSKGLPVQGKPVTITFGGRSVVSTTSVYGIAFSTFAAPASSGTFVSSAVFSGDLDYNSALSTAAVVVVLRKQPVPPVFTVEVASAAVTLSWTAVASPDQVAGHEVTGYEVYTAAKLRPGTWGEKVGSVASTAPTLGYTCPVDLDAATYLKVKTVLADKQESGATLIVEVPAKAEDPERVPNYYYLSQDNNAFVKIPGRVMDKLSGAAQVSVEIEKKTVPGFLLAYDMKPSGLSAADVSGINSGNRKGVKLSLYYPQPEGAVTSAASGQMALYWYNGVEWIKLGGELDVLTGEVYTYSRTFGRFAVKAAPLSSSFSLTKVVPRIFSPDAADPLNTINRATFFYENPGGGEVTIRIFDITGALVRRNLEYGGDGIMFWNGRDQGGAAVKGGVYIYQIEAGDKVATGTVVVAK